MPPPGHAQGAGRTLNAGLLRAPKVQTPSLAAIEQRRPSHVAWADAGKGFGAKRVQPPPPKKEKRKTVAITEGADAAVQQAMRLAEGGRKARPVDGSEAARGRVDYANVKNWGSGKATGLGELQLESFRTGSQDPGKAAGFYTQLTFAVVQAEEQGLVSAALRDRLPVRGRENLPEYERWSFRRPRYAQYLADQRAAHAALEQGVAVALAAGGDGGAAAALDCFSAARGLDRSQALAADLAALEASGDGGGQRGGGGAPGPSPAALGYARYLGKLAREAGPEGGGSESAREQACLKLVAHAYSSHMLLLTKGSTMGARAAERLGLFKAQAIHTYRSYPFDAIGKDPLKALQRNVNEAGAALSEAQRAAVVEELPRAVAHGIQLWEALAHTD